MPAQNRVSDLSKCPSDAHGCPACPHPPIGPAIAGSTNVMVNGLPALRAQDPGIHAVCCGPNTWMTDAHSGTVMINNKGAVRQGDSTKHCMISSGTMQAGSPNVNSGG